MIYFMLHDILNNTFYEIWSVTLTKFLTKERESLQEQKMCQVNLEKVWIKFTILKGVCKVFRCLREKNTEYDTKTFEID